MGVLLPLLFSVPRLRPMETVSTGQEFSRFFWQAMKGIPWHVFPTAFSSCPSALSWDSSQKVRGGFVRIQRGAHDSGCGPLPRARAQATECSLVRFSEHSVNSYANDGRIIPAIGEPPTPPSFDSAFELSCYLWVCLLVYRLGIKVYLNLTCHLGPN